MTFNSFIDRITTATQYSFTEHQINRLKTDCENIPEIYLKKIASTIETSPNHPKNIFGLVLGNIQWANDAINAENLKRERWKAKEDCATPEEFALTMEVTGLLCAFENSNVLLTSFSDKFLVAIKKECCIEFLKRAKEFYLLKIKEGVKLKKGHTATNAF